MQTPRGDSSGQVWGNRVLQFTWDSGLRVRMLREVRLDREAEVGYGGGFVLWDVTVNASCF